MKYWATTFVIMAYSSCTLGQFTEDSISSLLGNALDGLLAALGDNIIGSALEDTIDNILLDKIPPLLDQKPLNADGRFQQNRDFLLQDTSNDEIAHSSIQEIIRRSGYEVRIHEVISNDGYITLLYNVINPLADKTKLKQPPVMMTHGGLIDPTAFIWASSIQHHPEKYPRTAGDGPITSSNRSLAFMLANYGYDVWLAATRGSNDENQGRIYKNTDVRESRNGSKSFNLFNNQLDYWRFSFDELIQDEVPKQLDRVLELTGARNVSLFSYSFSALATLAMLGSRPDIAKYKIHNYISMAPYINIDSSNTVLKFLGDLALTLPDDLGTKLYPESFTTQPVRNFIVDVSRSKVLRYWIVKFFYSIALGSSGKYRTNLELSVLGHVLQPTSFKLTKHGFQINKARRIQMYDYGPIGNKEVYDQMEPPAYDISNIYVKNWLLISGQNDNLSPATAISQVLNEVNPKPLRHVRVPGVGHLDLVSTFNNDIQVNQPVLQFLNRFALT